MGRPLWVKIYAAVILLALALTACGGDDDDSGSTTNAQLAGNYRGAIQDSVAGQGTLTGTIAQNGNQLSGTFASTFSNAANNNSGSVTGMVSGNSLSFTLTPSRAGTCPFSGTGVVNGAQITGTYAAVNCTAVVSGSLSLTRQ